MDSLFLQELLNFLSHCSILNFFISIIRQNVFCCTCKSILIHYVAEILQILWKWGSINTKITNWTPTKHFSKPTTKLHSSCLSCVIHKGLRLWLQHHKGRKKKQSVGTSKTPRTTTLLFHSIANYSTRPQQESKYIGLVWKL